jgi:hypothetical protein
LKNGFPQKGLYDVGGPLTILPKSARIPYLQTGLTPSLITSSTRSAPGVTKNYTNDRTGKALLLSTSYVSELWNRTEDLIPTITIPLIATAATARQRSAWAKTAAQTQ